MRMTRLFIFVLFFILILSAPRASAQLVTGRFITSMYGWEHFDSVGVSQQYLRGFQSIALDVGKNDLSFHTQIEGAATLDSTFSKSTDLRAYYLYAKWRNICNAVDLSVGRQPYFAGAGFGTMDGLLAKARFGSTMQLTLYGGLPVKSDLSFDRKAQLKNSSLFGAQALITSIKNARLGLSFTNRQRLMDGFQTTRLDQQFNPVEYFVAPELDHMQIGSADVAYKISLLNIYGRFDYEFLTKKTLRGQFGLSSNVNEKLSLSAEMIYRAPHIPLNSFWSVFEISNNTEIEGGADYLFSPSLRAFLRGAFISYDDESSFRYTAGVATNNASLSYRGNSGYAGELQSITIQGMYPFFDNMISPVLAFNYSSYKLNKSETESTSNYTAIFGATFRPMKLLSLDVQGQWLHNKILNRDVRFFARLNVWFSEQLNLIP